MTPKELQPYHGLGRVDCIEQADKLMTKARIMAAACINDIDRGFSDFFDNDCTECFTRAECGLHVYDDTLLDAADFYEAAGLSILAERVRTIPETCVVTAWQHFDETNPKEVLP